MHRRVIRITDSLITPPVGLAVPVEYAKRHLRSLGNSDDVLVETWIRAATSYVEEQTGRQLLTATREAWLDQFPGLPGATYRCSKIELPHPPLQSVVSVSYIDGDGNEQVYEDGSTSPASSAVNVRAPQGDYAVPGTVEPLAGGSWPAVRDETGAVRIRYVCGYGSDAADVPELLRGVILYLVAHYDQFRGAVHEARRGQVLELPYGVKASMDGFKFSTLSTVVSYEQPPADGSEYYR